jgi:hypothetical protein
VTEIDLAEGILDHQLVDSEGRRCGKVDDLELAGVAAGTPHVTQLLSGPAAWGGRGRLGRLAAALARGRAVHVAWAEVERLDGDVHLRRPAAELRLGSGDARARRLLERLPGSSL